ncbi:MAG: GntR family transcriptional regulator [Gemmatimonadota bacterium]|nr:GntR family transcriptional regulator [Gemmatimonadota bacterium]
MSNTDSDIFLAPMTERTTLADRVYRLVRDRVLHAELAPGEFIREADLEVLGVSRTPIREALGRLASEGFLERIPHRGFRVPEEPVERLLELYLIVASLELLAGRLALPRFGPEDIARIRDINHRLSEAADPSEVRTRIELNNEFHHVFSERSGNRRLCDLLDDLRAQLGRLELWYYSSGEHTRESVREHDRIIDAIETGDHARALSLLEHNMSLTYQSLLEESSSQGEF